jgi:hypothetical protein
VTKLPPIESRRKSGARTKVADAKVAKVIGSDLRVIRRGKINEPLTVKESRLIDGLARMLNQRLHLSFLGGRSRSGKKE